MAFKQTGITTFTVDNETHNFTFSVTVSDKRMRMRFEDAVTREQWRTSELLVEDFTSAETVIPQAKLEHYAERIAACWAPVSEDAKITRSLSEVAEDGSRVLRVGFTIEPLGHPTMIEYSFMLVAVPLEPMDVLKARMRDLERTVEAMKEELRARPPTEPDSSATGRPLVQIPEVTSSFRTDGYSEEPDVLEWTQIGNPNESAFVERGGEIVVVQGGTYLISVCISHDDEESAKQLVEIVLDGRRLCTLCNNDDGADIDLISAAITAEIADEGRLQVFYQGDNYAYEGTMTVTRL